MSADETLTEKCKQYLQARWDYITSLCADGEPPDFLGHQHTSLKALVGDCLTSSIKSYHYVLPTQILCKVVDPSLDAHSLQAAWGVGAHSTRGQSRTRSSCLLTKRTSVSWEDRRNPM